MVVMSNLLIINIINGNFCMDFIGVEFMLLFNSLLINIIFGFCKSLNFDCIFFYSDSTHKCNFL